MKYLEDYISKDLIESLESEFKKIYDNEEFAICNFSMLESDDEARELLDYLRSTEITSKTRYKVVTFLMDLKQKRSPK